MAANKKRGWRLWMGALLLALLLGLALAAWGLYDFDRTVLQPRRPALASAAGLWHNDDEMRAAYAGLL